MGGCSPVCDPHSQPLLTRQGMEWATAKPNLVVLLKKLEMWILTWHLPFSNLGNRCNEKTSDLQLVFSPQHLFRDPQDPLMSLFHCLLQSSRDMTKRRRTPQPCGGPRRKWQQKPQPYGPTFSDCAGKHQALHRHPHLPWGPRRRLPAQDGDADKQVQGVQTWKPE